MFSNEFLTVLCCFVSCSQGIRIWITSLAVQGFYSPCLCFFTKLCLTTRSDPILSIVCSRWRCPCSADPSPVTLSRLFVTCSNWTDGRAGGEDGRPTGQARPLAASQHHAIGVNIAAGEEEIHCFCKQMGFANNVPIYTHQPCNIQHTQNFKPELPNPPCFCSYHISLNDVDLLGT